MSRIGNNPVILPDGVTAQVDGSNLLVTGPKGQLQLKIHPAVKAEVADAQVVVKRKKDDRLSRSIHGLMRSLIANMVGGVSQGWSQGLELVGVGYRAQGGGDNLTLTVGFSHPIQVTAPEGITFQVTDNTKIIVSGIDRQLVGQIAANIRAIKPPEVYKGKGIRFTGEYVRRKPGKAGKATGGSK